ncbi:preprotein translocase subunit YajC [Microbacterium betulae]|uniref:Preprotein translocase subunit YajC n=1 Tax=Microbacterium betulae TaxID=2981139 RepID=A0AA97FFQ1_9MICO|nr:preprotein translocase subunit YajC [Microbacterium sp. AB]WOF21544.1 preprotein translocase subunit YajC [Microbacterium sp. AB]
MDYLLLVVLAALLVFMFVSSRRRTKKLKEEQEQRQLRLVPGARVMTRSGLFGTIVEFDADDLTQPAQIEIAPDVVVEVHAQAIDLAPETEAVVEEEDTADAAESLENLSGADVETTTDEARPPQGAHDLDGAAADDLPREDKPKA